MSSTWQPLTKAQQGYWDEFSQYPDKALSIVAHCLEITGAVDLVKLEQAINQTVIEAQVFCLKFRPVANEPYPEQRVDLTERPYVELVDLRGVADAEQQAEQRMRTDVKTPLDLTCQTMTKVQLYVIDAEKVLWYLRTHHIAVDGYSMNLIEQRCAHLYQCLVNSELPQPGFKSFDVYLKEEADYLQGTRFAADNSYWQEYLHSVELPHCNGAGAIAATASVVRQVPPSVSHALIMLAQRLMIGWSDVLTLLSAAYLYQEWRRDLTNEPLPVWLPFMNRMGNPCANTPALMVNSIPFLVTVEQGLPIELWLKRAVIELRNHYRHGRYRVERELSSGEHYLLSPFINILPFESAQFPACSTAHKVIAGGVADGFNLTFRSNRQATQMSLLIEAEVSLFSVEELAFHADNLLAFLSKLALDDKAKELSLC